ncbi:ABC transporter substrate-binding protein [Actinoplanes sp. NPDC051851]|uniref:ABC transporter substrate-binding protein n=1 Tax=Actinoplanes sp. NPDC051851 TaxID=3154753 RepID=UPI00342AD4D5
MKRRTLLLGSVLVAAGCAKNGGSPGGDTSTLNVGQVSNSIAFLPFYIAEQKKLFEGVTLGERPRLGTGAKVAAALQSGSIDVAGSVMTDAFNLYKTNDQTRVIGSLVNTYYLDIVAGATMPTAGDTAPVADRIAALKGKKIGITGPGSGTEALVKYLFKKGGMDATKDAELVNLGSDASAALGALSQRRVDALSFPQPVGQLAVAAGAGRLYISVAAGDVPEIKSATHGVILTTQSVLDAKSDAVAAFLRGIAKAEALVHSDATGTGELLSGYQETMKPETVQSLVPILQQEIPESPLPPEEGYTASATFHQATGLITEVPPYSTIVPTTWINSALA